MNCMEYSDKSLVFLTRHGMEPERISPESGVPGFLAEMELGLQGRPRSLKMLPTYLNAEGVLPLNRTTAVIDAGGTNFRTALVHFDENGAVIERLALRRMPGTDGAVSWEEFIRTAAESVAPLLQDCDSLGFCFSYPTEETPERDGRMLCLTKQVELTGFENRLICADLRAELERMGRGGVKTVLLNDTPAVLLSGAGQPQPCDGLVGLICGTGTNTCCSLPIASVAKLGGGEGSMLINLESGGYSGMPRGDYDLEMDAATSDPGQYQLEKMCSGAYLGRLSLHVLRGAASEGLFSAPGTAAILEAQELTAPEADALASGTGSWKLEGADAALAGELCYAVFDRAARVICTKLSAILLLTDSGIEPARPARICADGSVIRHSRAFSTALGAYMNEFTQGRLGRYTSFYTAENATLTGTAAAALLNT